MDIPTLAADVAKTLAPALPFLKWGVEKAAEGAIGELGKQLWEKLRNKITANAGARKAAEQLAINPNDRTAQAALAAEIKKILAEDPSLAKSVSKIVQNITMGDISGTVAISQQGDAIAGDKVLGDKIAGDKIAGHKIEHYHEATSPLFQSLHQLPPPLADFTGRDDELNELHQLADSGGALISGLQGAGGIGKTALAIVLAHEWKDGFPDAQIFLNLHGVDPAPLSPDKAMEQIIHAFHPDAKLPDDPDALANIYRSLLDGKRALLLLDNARHAAQVEPLLPPASCGVIVTSRWNFALPGMKTKDITVLTPENAANLLLSICGGIGNHAAAIAQKCGYMPYALRLAGSALLTTPMLKPEDYLQRLSEDRINKLDPESKYLQVSYDLLGKSQQTAWRALGVFTASFDQSAAAAVCNLGKDAPETLAALHSASMLEWNKADDRYRLHDLAREFANSQLSPAERDAAILRHASHYRDVAWEADKLYKQKENVLRGLQLFDRERAHIEAAFVWLLSRH
ncbi:MAG: hypothetical protein HY300_08385, partial [Verrucomicrobia bacterium]|nr:hypothetical protein [Verrucomicrobiota bacterium]